METNNETIDDIIKDILENDGMCISPTSLFGFDEDGGILLGDLAERIKVAHEREIASKDAEIVKLRAALKPVLAVCPTSYESHFVSGGSWRVPLYNGKLCEAAVLEAQRIYKEAANV